MLRKKPVVKPMSRHASSGVLWKKTHIQHSWTPNTSTDGADASDNLQWITHKNRRLFKHSEVNAVYVNAGA